MRFKLTHLPDKVRIIVTRSVNPAGEESMIAILQTWRGNPGRCVAQAHRKLSTEKIMLLKKYTYNA